MRVESKKSRDRAKTGFCVFIDSLCEGSVPSVFGGDEKPIVFSTEAEAELEIIENAIDRIEEHLYGERDFEDAMTIEEYAVEVEIPNSNIQNPVKIQAPTPKPN